MLTVEPNDGVIEEVVFVEAAETGAVPREIKHPDWCVFRIQPYLELLYELQDRGLLEFFENDNKRCSSISTVDYSASFSLYHGAR